MERARRSVMRKRYIFRPQTGAFTWNRNCWPLVVEVRDGLQGIVSVLDSLYKVGWSYMGMVSSMPLGRSIDVYGPIDDVYNAVGSLHIC